MDIALAGSAPELSPVILFGLDPQGKGHASLFEPDDAALAERAAGLMGMRVLRLASEEDRALAEGVAKGRVFGSGKAFAPFCSRERYDRLAAQPGSFAPPPPADTPAKAPGEAKGSRSTSAGAEGSLPEQSGPERPGVPAPDWDSITLGSLVLAAEEGAPAAWYVATVVADRGEGLFELQWWQDEDGQDGELPLIVRRREHLGLFPPAVAEALA